ncbi:hypothetical protein [Desulfobacter sp. UBA2225]|uniref:hypothetical protein n=1 Tax=Desulfobacter sp. UBA2225 TaxID=1961413 RepID=UPI00257C0C42|nr:hypothetical protein [Desulfobacter sp. UBA2225]
MALNFYHLLKIMIDEGGDVLYLTCGSCPCIRVHGGIKRIEHPSLSSKDLEDYFNSSTFENDRISFSFSGYVCSIVEVARLGRFSVSWQGDKFDKKGLKSIVKSIPSKIQSLLDLGINIHELNSPFLPGIYLIGGYSKSGRSTTLSSLIDNVNRNLNKKLIAIQPYSSLIHYHKKSLVETIVPKNANEIKQITEFAISTSEANCIYIDGYYGRAALEAILFAARCGLLCFATVLGQSVEAVIQNILFEWPQSERDYILTFLAKHLNCILCQALLPSLRNSQTLAYEFLNCSNEVRTLIEIGRIKELRKHFSDDYRIGENISLEKSVIQLYKNKYISHDTLKSFFDLNPDKKSLKIFI